MPKKVPERNKEMIARPARWRPKPPPTPAEAEASSSKEAQPAHQPQEHPVPSLRNTGGAALDKLKPPKKRSFPDLFPSATLKKEESLHEKGPTPTSMKKGSLHDTPEYSKPLKKRVVRDVTFPSTPLSICITPSESLSSPPAAPSVPTLIRTESLPPPSPILPLPPTASAASVAFARGTEPAIAPTKQTPNRRRIEAQNVSLKQAEVPENAQRECMFEGISKESLQRYMNHFQIQGCQDLKKNLAQRVQEHFDQMDHNEIDLVELNKGVRQRFAELAVDAAWKSKQERK